jgi:hypothetical protein
MHIHYRLHRIAAVCSTLLAISAPFAQAAEVAEVLAPRWEVTIGASGKHSAEAWKFALPDAEIQYQFSERLQLTSKLSWAIIHPEGASSKSAPGTGKAGFKWRIMDLPDSAFSLALCPEIARYMSRSSVRRGIVSAQREYALPIEIKLGAGGVEFELNTGRNFIEGAPDEWMLELKATHPCLPQADCVLTLERNFVPMEVARMLVKPGIDWKLNNTLTLKTALGREIGARNADLKDLVVSVGLQIVY